jgi:hypothetical protein
MNQKYSSMNENTDKKEFIFDEIKFDVSFIFAIAIFRDDEYLAISYRKWHLKTRMREKVRECVEKLASK